MNDDQFERAQQTMNMGQREVFLYITRNLQDQNFNVSNNVLDYS